jgi:DNA-binding transcriptional LysR family regulator
MDKLAAMRAFVEIADRGSLTAAGDALDRSLPTMVRTLGALEASLGTTLLRRTTRHMSLTPEGRTYLEHCRRILADIEQAEDLVGARGDEPRGPLVVSAPVMFGRMHVAPAAVEFVRRYPKVEVDLLLLDRVVDLIDEGVDVAVRIAHLADSSMIAMPVGAVRRVVCASPKFLKLVGEPRAPADIANRPCVRFRGLMPENRWLFRDGAREIAVPVHGAFMTNHADAALDACMAGLGFGLFLSYQVEPAVRARKLCVVLRDYELPAIPVSLVHAQARLPSPRLRAFVEWMKPRLRDRI